MKKLLSLIALLFVSVYSTNAMSVSVYVDFSASAQLDAANSLAVKGIIKDKSSTPSEYNLGSNILRQEIAVVVKAMADLELNSSCKGYYSDLSSTKPNDWACVYVETLADAELVSRNSTYRPEDTLTKTEALKLMLTGAGYTNVYTDVSKWQEQVVEFAVEKGIVNNFTDYNTPATRGWIFIIADASIKLEAEEAEKKMFSDEVSAELEEILSLYE